MLFIIAGPSGVGKSTLAKRLFAAHPEIGFSISCTTRAPRGEEQDGVEYHFLTEEKFRELIEAGAFAEWAKVHGKYYGTLRETIDDALLEGRSVLFDIDSQGREQLQERYPNATTVMILPPSVQVLEQRLRGRGTDDEAVILKRLANAKQEMAQAPLFQHIIVNDDIEEAWTLFRGVYLAGRSRTERVWPELCERFSG